MYKYFKHLNLGGSIDVILIAFIFTLVELPNSVVYLLYSIILKGQVKKFSFIKKIHYELFLNGKMRLLAFCVNTFILFLLIIFSISIIYSMGIIDFNTLIFAIVLFLNCVSLGAILKYQEYLKAKSILSDFIYFSLISLTFINLKIAVLSVLLYSIFLIYYLKTHIRYDDLH